MPSVSRVLVPIDLKSNSTKSIETAVKFFPDAKIYFLNVVEAAGDVGIPSETAEKFFVDLREAARTQLKTSVNGLGKSHGNTEIMIETGKAAPKIIQVADALKIDLVILESGGSSNLARTFFGSTTYNVSRKINCSAWIIK